MLCPGRMRGTPANGTRVDHSTDPNRLASSSVFVLLARICPFIVLLCALTLTAVALPSPAHAAPAMHLPPDATRGDCTGKIAVVVASDADAQSDVYSAVTLAGALGTECLVLAGERTGPMPPEQRARLDRAASGGYVVGGTSAVPTSKLAGRTMKRIGGADRWETARAVGTEVALLVGDMPAEGGQIVGEAAGSCPARPYRHRSGKVNPALDLRCADLRGADMTGLNMRRINLYQADLRDAKLEGVNLHDASLSGADLRNADLDSVQFFGASLLGADLRRADLRKSILAGADITCADFSGANLQDAVLPGLLWRPCIFKITFLAPNFADANLRRASLVNTDFNHVDFSNADLRESSLDNADFTHANLEGADLRNADLTRANFFSANLNGADLRGATLTFARFDYATTSGCRGCP